MGIEQAGPAIDLGETDTDSNRNHLAACAREKIHDTLFDSNAAARRRLERMRDRGEDRNIPSRSRRLPPQVVCPWSHREAERQLAPYLGAIEDRLEDEPLAHLPLAYAVHRAGYEPFRDIVADWVAQCDTRGLGAPETSHAVQLASRLNDEADAMLERIEAGEPLPGWGSFQRKISPLLRDPHRLVAAHAARLLGVWYSGATERDLRRPALAPLLTRISGMPNAGAAVAGAFINGFDADSGGFAVLADHLPDSFDLDSWAIELLAKDPEPYLPGVQALWFYVHEHYDHSPTFVHRLIDQGLFYIALMCATEWQEPVAGMEEALYRLARQPDTAIAARAFDHLVTVYTGHKTQH